MPAHGTGRGRGRSGAVTSHPKGAPRSGKAVKQRTFDEYYSEIYGERWPALRAAMTVTPRKVALWNRFSQVPFEDATRGLVRVDARSVTQAFQPASASPDAKKPHDATVVSDSDSHGHHHANEEEGNEVYHEGGIIDKPPIDAFGIKAYYLMDYASTYIVEQLQVGSFDKVLDMCAAPGGKAIAIAQFLSPDGSLSCNETRADRCARLRRNLQEHIPFNYVPWQVTQRDAQTWYDPAAYTRVLVDAPCSSERHLLHQSRGAPLSLGEWCEETTRELAALQRVLLLRAIETCAVGGRVVYSTCSISPLENDGVIAEVLQRTRCHVKVVKASSLSPATSAEGPSHPPVLGEATAYGRLLLPDATDGWGPMFCCVLEKVGEHKSIGSSSSDEVDESSDEEN
jgi:5-methylcytosine rRNA methyltransferase NSUN4